MAYIDDVAKEFRLQHPGIPDDKTSRDLIESFFIVIKKRINRTGEFKMEGLGQFSVEHFKGAAKKKAPDDGSYYKIAERNVLKFKASSEVQRMLNLSRPKREKLES